MDLTVHQESFSAGEISPLTQGRHSSEGYKSGCKELLNMVPDSHGPAMSRDGTKYITQFAGDNGRIFGHAVSNSFFYSIILLNLKMVIAGIDGTIPAVNHAVNSRFHTLDANWTVGVSDSGQTVIFEPHHCVLTVTASANKWARIAQQITVPSAGDYKVIAQADGGALYRVDVGTAAGDDTYGTVTSANTEEIIDVTVPGTTFWITFTKDSNDSFDPVHLHFFGVGDDPVVAPEFVTPWAEDELDSVHAIPVPDGDATYFIHPFYAPYKLEYDIATDSFAFAIVSLSNPPTVWTGSNWPSVGAYFQGRLWLGSTPEQPQSLWGSKSALPEDFDPGTGLDDEAVAIILAQYGRIEWVASTKNLLIGTEAAEHIITSEGGVITPDDHQVDQQSAYGSASIQAQQVGDQVFYVSPDRKKLRAMQYEWSADNWLSTDLTYFSEHITGARIKAVAWLQNPQNLFITIMDDGTFAVLSYDRSNNIYGWSQHTIGAECIAINVTSVEGTSILGMLVKRADGYLYYESQALHTSHDIIFMDSWDQQFFVTPVTVVSGLDHLEGETVQILADRATHPDRVVSGGSVTLAREASETAIGIKYISRIGLLPVEKGSPTGPSAPWMKNFHSLDVHLLNSAHPLVNGDRAAVRTPSTPMDTSEPVVTGKSYISLLGWKNETDITIEQDLPFPLIVTGVSGKLRQEKL